MNKNTLKFKVINNGIECYYYIDETDYKIQANWYAKKEDRLIPYPEIDNFYNRPKLNGVGLLEQITNKTYYDKKEN